MHLMELNLQLLAYKACLQTHFNIHLYLSLSFEKIIKLVIQSIKHCHNNNNDSNSDDIRHRVPQTHEDFSSQGSLQLLDLEQ